MARTAKAQTARSRWRPRIGQWVLRGLAAVVIALLVVVLAYRFLPVPVTPYQLSEAARLGGVQREWVPVERVSPVMLRSAVAAEDANFCEHWGFDIGALRQAVKGGARRGGSTISQQTVKNVFLWQGRSWPRKALEAVLTPLVELAWPKRRILEVYLNVIEFDEGVFGIQAASQHYFKRDASALDARQAARLAAILPDPKDRSASRPSVFVDSRARAIRDGAETLRRDGRAACFSG